MRFLVLAAILLATASARAELAPSYDCTAAGTPVERAVCADRDLAQADLDMAALYERRLADLRGAARDRLRDDQRSWAASRERLCELGEGLTRCLAGLYADRIADLSDEETRLLINAEPALTVEGKSATACFDFDRPLADMTAEAARNAVMAEPDDRIAAQTYWSRLCVEGLPPGRDSVVTVKAGLMARDGAALLADRRFSLRAPDYPASVRFATRGRILPAGASGAPLETVNAPIVRLSVLRVTDEDVLAAARAGFLDSYFSTFDLGRLTARLGDQLWTGMLETGGARNETMRTAAPLAEALGEDRLPGLYLASAAIPGKEDSWDEPAFLFFTVSDIGLTTLEGRDGMTAVARSVATGDAAQDVRVVLRAEGGAVMAEAETGRDGLATLPAAAFRGEGEDAPRLLAAYGDDGDFVWLDLDAVGIDLSERGSAGRSAPGPIDGYATTERGVYRPGETVHLLTLLRDDAGDALADLPAEAIVTRPDGLEVWRRGLRDAGTGALEAAFDLPPTATTGPWRAEIEVGGEAVAQTRFLVEDFVPPRIAVETEAVRAAAPPVGPMAIAVQGDFLYGAPASGLEGEITGSLRAAAAPGPGLAGYVWGRADERGFETRLLDEIAFTLDETGAARPTVPIDAAGAPSGPVEAQLRIAVFDVGGRPVSDALTVPIAAAPAYLGLRPTELRSETSWYDRPRLSVASAFDLIAVAPGGARLDGDVTWRLVEESADYIWWRSGSGWNSRQTIADRGVIAEGAATLDAETPVQIAPPLESWRHYRLEVDDADRGVSMAYRFWTGWGGGETVDRAPDGLRIEIPDGPHRPGDRIAVRVTPPYNAMVQLTTAGDRVHAVTAEALTAAGGEIEITLPEGPTAGVYILANAFMRPDGGRFQAPLRAIGAAWVAYDTTDRTIALSVEAPERIEPETAVDVTVSGAPAGARLWLAAVDEGVLRLTNFASPDPAGHFLSQRALGVDLRDVYGRFIDAGNAPLGRFRQGGDAAALSGSANLANLPRRSRPVVSFVSGVVTAGADGGAVIPLDVPDFEGRLRLMAMGWTDRALGAGQADLIVRRPLVAELAGPRFLAPGDEAEFTLSLRSVDAPEGDYRWRVAADGPVTLGAASGEVLLAPGDAAAIPIAVTAEGLGDANFTVTLDGPMAIERQFALSIRSGAGVETRRSVQEVAPGAVLQPDLALAAGLDPATVSVRYGLNPLPDLDLPAHTLWLQRYPYGCAEQTISTTMPLLAATSLREHFDIRFPGPPEDALERGLTRLTGMQTPDGGFGLWSASDDADDWVSVYALDLMTRAGRDDVAVGRATSFVRSVLDREGSDARTLAVRAYALAVLTGRGAASAAEARRFHARWFADLTSPFSRGQLGLALARTGETELAQAAFRAALRDAPLGDYFSSGDYGSPIRDRAGALAAAAESGVVAWADLRGPAEMLAAAQAGESWLSTQERAWLLRAGEALRLAADADAEIEIDDSPIRLIGGAPRFVSHDAGGGPRLRNAGDAPLYGVTTVVGTPATVPQEGDFGFSVSRGYLGLDGQPIDPQSIRQNDVVIVMIGGALTRPGQARALVVDYLPAGLELENARLGGADRDESAWWVGELTDTVHVELRDDRFVAAVDLDSSGDGSGAFFSVAYLARAVTPGQFSHVGTVVEDMYQPDQRGRGGPMTLVVE